MYGPRLEGRVAIMRPPRDNEIATISSWMEDFEVTRLLGPNVMPTTVEKLREWVEKMGVDERQVFWFVEHEGRLVGNTGIHEIDWRNGNARTGTVIGDRSAWGRGLASEVMKLRADFAFRQLNLRKLRSGYYEGNEASARAQAGCGYVVAGRHREEMFRDGRWHDLILTELMRSDWENQHPE
jgi:RimJ/RimL family protein N-acetyltransferase